MEQKERAPAGFAPNAWCSSGRARMQARGRRRPEPGAGRWRPVDMWHSQDRGAAQLGCTRRHAQLHHAKPSAPCNFSLQHCWCSWQSSVAVTPGSRHLPAGRGPPCTRSPPAQRQGSDRQQAGFAGGGAGPSVQQPFYLPTAQQRGGRRGISKRRASGHPGQGRCCILHCGCQQWSCIAKTV